MTKARVLTIPIMCAVLEIARNVVEIRDSW
jgi:hypothetical protein